MAARAAARARPRALAVLERVARPYQREGRFATGRDKIRQLTRHLVRAGRARSAY